MFDLEKYAKESEIAVSSAKLTIRDLRTGESSEVMFYRPGANFPMEIVRRELAKYGYELDICAMPDPPQAVVNWERVYRNIGKLDLSGAL